MLVIGIARNIPAAKIIPAFEAAVSGGITHLEITMNSAGAAELIRKTRSRFTGIKIGAGTVLSLSSLHEALDSGAEFIVSPHTDPEIIGYCIQRNIPVYPGASTPTEIFKAWECGASMVKVFPVESLGGPEYIRYIKGPFNNVKLLACGGITDKNINQYRESGADGIALGGSLFREKWINNGLYEAVRDYAALFVR